MEKKRWVAGFLFHRVLGVALIRKAKPEWQAGKLNGVGGKIESGETPKQAMVREWQEETGTICTLWREFCQLQWKGGTVYFFVAWADDEVGDFKATLYEPVSWFNVADALKYENTIPNLSWLIPMARDKDRVSALVLEEDQGHAWSATLQADREG